MFFFFCVHLPHCHCLSPDGWWRAAECDSAPVLLQAYPTHCWADPQDPTHSFHKGPGPLGGRFSPGHASVTPLGPVLAPVAPLGPVLAPLAPSWPWGVGRPATPRPLPQLLPRTPVPVTCHQPTPTHHLTFSSFRGHWLHSHGWHLPTLLLAFLESGGGASQNSWLSDGFHSHGSDALEYMKGM